MMHLTYSKIFSSSKRRHASVLDYRSLLYLTALSSFFLLSSAIGGDLDLVRELIARGEIAQARQELRMSPWHGERYEWEILNLRLSPGGETSRTLAEELLQFDLNDDQLTEVIVFLARYYQVLGKTDDALQLLATYEKRCRSSSAYLEFAILRAELRLASDGASKSVKELRKTLKSCPGSPYSTLAALRIGDALLIDGKGQEALSYYTKVAQVSECQYRGFALSRLEKAYRETGSDQEADDVFSVFETSAPGFFYREGQDVVVAQQEPEPEPESEAIKVSFGSIPLVSRSNGFFAVRVGSFAAESDARALHERFSSQGYTSNLALDIKKGKKFFVVDIGRFSDAPSAARFMERLQRVTQDSYSVVSR